MIKARFRYGDGLFQRVIITDKTFLGHIKDISLRAEKSGRYFFTSFLTQAQQSDIESMKRELCTFKFYGGADMTERNMARFGDENEIGWEQDFPITILKVSPLNAKFADALTHRDFLGALMNLGIERDQIGDIAVRDNEAYIFATDKMADYICEKLDKVKHTNVKCEITDNIPDGELYRCENEEIIVSSVRIDCVIAGVFKLSRNEAQNLIESEKVFVNSRAVISVSKELCENDVVSVRGYGKFVFSGEKSRTKKGRIVIAAGVYK